MKPWFLKEGEVIDFPKKDDKVIKLPTIDHYDSFFDGVRDLQAQLERGDISKTVYNKLYTDLIHRFAKKESMEPWFIKEAPQGQGIMSLPQASRLKDEVEKAIAQMDLSQTDNVELLRKMYGVLRTTGIENRMKTIFSKDNDNQGNVLTAMGKKFLELANQEPDEANQFLSTYEKNPNVVDTAKLIGSPGQIQSTESLFVGDFAKKFGLALSDIKGEGYKKAGYAGPGEIALACLSNQISLGEGETGGDIVINKKGYEVKGNEGRLFDKGQVDFKNVQKYLGQSDMSKAGNLSVDDLASIDPEMQDVEADRLKVGKGKKGITSDQAIWVGKDQAWWNRFIKALATDWFGSQWSKYSNELANRMGTGGSFKVLWLQLQFARYKEIANHNGIVLFGKNRFLFATKGEHLKNNIKNWGTAYSQNIGQVRELSTQLKI